MKWNWYIVTLRHDLGRFRVRVYAQDEAHAKRIVTAAERAPDRAVISVKLTA